MKCATVSMLVCCTAPPAAITADPTSFPPTTTQVPATATGDAGATQRAQVHVTQPVGQPAPEIIVRQPPPTIAVQMPQPEIIMRMPKPETTVATPPSQVSVSESKREAQVDAAKPNVNVTPRQQGNVQTPESRPSIPYEQTGYPEVVVKSAPGQPQTRFEETSGAVRGQPPAAGTAGPGAPSFVQVSASDLRKAEVYDSSGNKVGRVDHVGMDDQIVRASVTNTFVAGLCSSGAVVRYVVLRGADTSRPAGSARPRQGNGYTTGLPA